MPRFAPVRPRAPHESGYALLMILLLAAILALTLYQSVPRFAFEAERDKEQLLIDRGEQYKRGIQLYYRKMQRYPVKMEDLENTNNIRFLRHRYVDPMTGKDEWRLIHVGPGGVFTDSLTQKKTDPNKKAAAPQTFITEMPSLGDSGTGAADAVNPGLRRRPSDGAAGAGAGNDQAPVFPTDPFATGPNGLAANGGGSQANPGFPNGGVPASGDIGLPGPGNSVGPNGNQFGNAGVNPGALPSGAPGTTSNGANAAAMIVQMLTGPRPGGPPPGIFSNNNGSDPGSNFPAPQSTVQATANGSSPFGNNIGTTAGGAGGAGQVLAGSFAGVASTAEKPSIKTYNDRHKYNEWEFIYDYSKDLAKAAGLAVNNSGVGTGNNGAAGAGAAGNSASAFGNSFGNNNASGSGGNTTGSPTPPVAVPQTTSQ